MRFIEQERKKNETAHERLMPRFIDILKDDRLLQVHNPQAHTVMDVELTTVPDAKAWLNLLGYVAITDAFDFRHRFQARNKAQSQRQQKNYWETCLGLKLDSGEATLRQKPRTNGTLAITLKRGVSEKKHRSIALGLYGIVWAIVITSAAENV